jgi:hypothetical protein
MLAAIYPGSFARHETGIFQIEDGIYDLVHLSHPANRMQVGEEFMRRHALT